MTVIVNFETASPEYLDIDSFSDFLGLPPNVVVAGLELDLHGQDECLIDYIYEQYAEFSGNDDYVENIEYTWS